MSPLHQPAISWFAALPWLRLWLLTIFLCDIIPPLNLLDKSLGLKCSTHPFVISCGMMRLPCLKKGTQEYRTNDKSPWNFTINYFELFSKGKCLHIIDACSGAGSCALACSSLGRKLFASR